MRHSTFWSRCTLYLQLIRFDKPVGSLLLLWPTLSALWIASDGRPPLTLLLIFIAGTVLMRSAGCALNDYADRHLTGMCSAPARGLLRAENWRRARRWSAPRRWRWSPLTCFCNVMRSRAAYPS